MHVENRGRRFEADFAQLLRYIILTPSKCDERQPYCSRCVRLGMKCSGSGEKKYVFKEVNVRSTDFGNTDMYSLSLEVTARQHAK